MKIVTKKIIKTNFDPDYNCNACQRLVEYRNKYRKSEPQWHNGPVDTWVDERGADNVKLLVIGMAPGLKGANRTGRPFTGDYAGDLLYQTLSKYGLAKGEYGSSRDDSLQLLQCAITNAVRCVPPQNKPIGEEVNNCRPYLVETLNRFKNVKVLMTLGKIAHDTTARTLDTRVASVPFGHNRRHEMGKFTVFSRYHCSRYNTNTGRLTAAMFEDVFDNIVEFIG
ncbi:MAG: uracil-DNA glycosylase [Rhizobiaceae bacterium]|nr:uracil-DNA glycosylase [Rhizobiaceae bacterium]